MTSLLDGVDVVLADLDGVIYKGAGAIPFAVESINAASATGVRAMLTSAGLVGGFVKSGTSPYTRTRSK